MSLPRFKYIGKILSFKKKKKKTASMTLHVRSIGSFWLACFGRNCGRLQRQCGLLPARLAFSAGSGEVDPFTLHLAGI